MPEQDRHQMGRALFSVDSKEWEDFEKLAGKNRRAEVLRAFIAWYLHRPGAKLPRRPAGPE